MWEYSSNDALTRLQKRKYLLEKELDQAYIRNDALSYIVLESKHRSISMAIARMRNSAI